ncbi:MAG: pyrroloquinoline quinone biosynthesis protein PqqB [Bacteroidetes bacterium]|nr:pyrroloquinoline quinone biosynthesis protein PqqB [Bacteroidota bacterium]
MNFRLRWICFLLIGILACNTSVEPRHIIASDNNPGIEPPFLLITGTVQDGGSPHIGCDKDCCRQLFHHPDTSRMVTSLSLIDQKNHLFWMFEASPDFSKQCRISAEATGEIKNGLPSAIFLTHAHIGHYTGLMYLGKEAKGADNIPVYAMPRMTEFLKTNGPWSQLVAQNNITLMALNKDSTIQLTKEISVTPFLVPHRDEFSETVGFIISGANKKVLFIPDINKWKVWNRNIMEVVNSVDIALIDGTFYNEDELPARNMSEIPHPFITETMELFESTDSATRSKIHFIHLNHSNPLLIKQSSESNSVKNAGFKVACFGDKIQL